ncbi:MAG: biotin/lipoyl-containing protein [Candidatus Zhuqueibacterota bacterium]
MKNYKFSINGNPYGVIIKQLGDDHAIVEVNGAEYQVDIIEEPIQRKTPQLVRSKVVPDTTKRPIQSTASHRAGTSGVVKAPLPGLITQILVKEGDQVDLGQHLLKMEAMKMENNIQSTKRGKVTSIKVKAGDTVLEGDVLVEIGG